MKIYKNCIEVNLCQSCYDQMHEEYGEDLGFTKKPIVTIASGPECDYEQLPDGSFKYEHELVQIDEDR